MTLSRTLKLVLLAGIVSIVDPGGDRTRRHGIVRHRILCRSKSGATADAGQRGWRRPPHDSSLRRWSL